MAAGVLKIGVFVMLMSELCGLELYYFNEKGRAEPIRLMLHFAGINFTDYRFSRADWNAAQYTLAFSTIPAIVDDMTIVANSGAITRYVAQITHLLTPTVLEDAKLDALFEQSQPLLNSVLQYIDIVEGRSPGDANASRYNLVDYPAQYYLPMIEAYTDNNTGLFGHSDITYMDFAWYNILDLINYYAPDVLLKYYASINHWNRVDGYNNSNLQKYLLNRYLDFARNDTFQLDNVF
ncbi:unnamed protein product [Bursaphelenchus xylophilus]|uniref:(pine wood nematode) hypothetical protein n=1 Tax=Bursaphelenchus xylophilus TaxID=6326 RepID=A0A1I7RQJ4_BURXY|nr:unnamed protein product [Bursaphelenchus xylophilus]CAG9104687.1 unnamed protein product [Bursaphelenchus xylophilus]